jgi:hypothetical protein
MATFYQPGSRRLGHVMYLRRGLCLYTENSPVRGGRASERSTSMRRFRSFITRTPAVVISTLAVALSLGGGAYASTLATGHGHAGHPGNAPAVKHVVKAGPNTAATPTVQFNTLTLINGWVSENPVYQSGNPKVGIQNGIVYLKGSLAQPSPGNDTFTVLPPQYRPTDNMYITVYTNGGTQGSLYIGHDGTMELFSNTSCGSGTTSQCFSSLATVSYPVNS